jgi:hypothetical protein
MLGAQEISQSRMTTCSPDLSLGTQAKALPVFPPLALSILIGAFLLGNSYADLSAAETQAYQVQGLAKLESFYPKPSSRNKSVPEGLLVERRSELITPFSLIAECPGERWFCRITWSSNAFTEAGFDGTNVYDLLKSPIKGGESLSMGSISILGSTNGLPENSHCLVRFLWLGFASGQAIRQMKPAQLTVPWAAGKAIIPESDCFTFKARLHDDLLGCPESVKFFFSTDLWKRDNRKLSPPFNAGDEVGSYQVISVTNLDSVKIPVAFEMTRAAEHLEWTLERYRADVTSIVELEEASFVPDPKPYTDGVTVQDDRVLDPTLGRLIIAYNITNAPYPSPNAEWLQPLWDKERNRLIQEHRAKRLKNDEARETESQAE